MGVGSSRGVRRAVPVHEHAVKQPAAPGGKEELPCTYRRPARDPSGNYLRLPKILASIDYFFQRTL